MSEQIPAERIKLAKPMKHELFSRSPVDIIIPYHGQYEKVVRLVESILLVTKSNPYRITLVDDFSPNEKFVEDLRKVPQAMQDMIRVVRTPKRLGFGGALRVGYDNTEQPWVCFMHSDCLVEDQNWLLELGQSLMRWRQNKSPVKMVSARTNNPGEDAPRYLKADQRARGEDVAITEGHLPLFCSMCNRELFYHIGGFIKPYPYGWYEDMELAERMKVNGFQQGICGKSWVRHEGGATINSIWKETPEIRKCMEENRTRCIMDLKNLA